MYAACSTLVPRSRRGVGTGSPPERAGSSQVLGHLGGLWLDPLALECDTQGGDPLHRGAASGHRAPPQRPRARGALVTDVAQAGRLGRARTRLLARAAL